MKALFFIYLVCVAFSTIAQDDLVPGYIINVKNDTIKGEIKLSPKNEMDYYVKVLFKGPKAPKAKPQLPAKIHGYGFDNKYFAATKYFNNWVFMQVVCRGKLMFYEYKPPVALGNDKMESIYLILKSGTDEMVQIFPEAKVKKQIKPFISDDKELLKEIEKEELDYAKLVQLIDKYNSRNP